LLRDASGFLDRGFRLLIEQGMLHEIGDSFGPPLYFPKEAFNDVWEKLREDQNLPFFMYSNAPYGAGWLKSALEQVNAAYEKLGIEPADFEDPNVEWEPIPLDRNDATLNTAIEKIDEVIEEVRTSNGYADTLPEERTFVLDKLSNLSARLKTEATISWMYVKEFGLMPLQQVIVRFGNAAVGVVASAAKDALAAWLRANTSKAIEWLLRQFF
jgi:hypothetical protein